MDTLLIRLMGDDSAHWAVMGAGGDPQDAGQGELETAAAQAHHRRVIVLVPTDNILLTRVKTRARKAQQLAKAVPYALEDELAEDIDHLHFAMGPPSGDNEHTVAVVSHDQMQDWLAHLEGASLTPHALIPDVLGLPYSDGAWSVLLEDQRAVVRTEPYGGFIMEPDNLERLLTSLAETPEQQPEELAVYRCEPAPSRHKVDFPVPYTEHDRCPPTLFAESLNTSQTINLLQGAYRSQDNVAGLFKPWRTAAILAGVWVIASLCLGYYQNWQLGHENATLATRIESTYRDTFPNAQRIVNPRVQMEQRLNELQHSQSGDDTTQFMSMLHTGGNAVHGARNVAIRTFTYRKGRLVFDLTASDLQSLERIKQAIQKDGLSADIESADSRGKNVNARLNIQQ